MNYFTYNGTSSAYYGLLVNGSDAFRSASKDIESVVIPGRNGELTLSNNRYNNIQVSYEICLPKNFASASRDIAAWLNSPVGYAELSDNYYTGSYRMARFNSELSVTPYQLALQGSGTVVFDCRPERFLTSGQTAVTYTADGTIENSTSFNAKPLIRAYGTGTLTIGDYSLEVTAVSSTYTDIDCETMQCYEGSTNCNSNVTLDDFPEIEPGTNTITITGFSSVEITPRWWIL